MNPRAVHTPATAPPRPKLVNREHVSSPTETRLLSTAANALISAMKSTGRGKRVAVAVIRIPAANKTAAFRTARRGKGSTVRGTARANPHTNPAASPPKWAAASVPVRKTPNTRLYPTKTTTPFIKGASTFGGMEVRCNATYPRSAPYNPKMAPDAPALMTLEAGDVPAEWQPLDTTTEEEAVFLAPLDIVSARGRARVWFDFDYVWEVYKPAHQRRWGYYTLPILYGDRLVARFDPKLDRTTNTLLINGLWLETAGSAEDPAFVSALARGLQRFRQFLQARQIDLSAINASKAAVKLAKQLKGHWA